MPLLGRSRRKNGQSEHPKAQAGPSRCQQPVAPQPTHDGLNVHHQRYQFGSPQYAPSSAAFQSQVSLGKAKHRTLYAGSSVDLSHRPNHGRDLGKKAFVTRNLEDRLGRNERHYDPPPPSSFIGLFRTRADRRKAQISESPEVIRPARPSVVHTQERPQDPHHGHQHSERRPQDFVCHARPQVSTTWPGRKPDELTRDQLNVRGRGGLRGHGYFDPIRVDTLPSNDADIFRRKAEDPKARAADHQFSAMSRDYHNAAAQAQLASTAYDVHVKEMRKGVSRQELQKNPHLYAKNIKSKKLDRPNQAETYSLRSQYMEAIRLAEHASQKWERWVKDSIMNYASDNSDLFTAGLPDCAQKWPTTSPDTRKWSAPEVSYDLKFACHSKCANLLALQDTEYKGNSTRTVQQVAW